jgi:hypothetical protein
MKPNILHTVPEQGLLTYLHPHPKGILEITTEAADI